MSIKPNNEFRFLELDEKLKVGYRSEIRRDYARVLHCASFRRLEHKTQLFPGDESDFFRNRLTHSLEVAQIAKTIALKMLYENDNASIEPDICEVAGLAHDLGHPPFGHNGEKALDNCMIHWGGFEGNAQTFRILARIEKKETKDCPYFKNGIDNRVGLNLTARVLASILKYDKLIPISRAKNSDICKGYYDSEKDIVQRVKNELGSTAGAGFRTIECAIMDLADDIAYSTYDLEDAFKAGFLTPYEMMSADERIFGQIVEKLKKDKVYKDANECRAEIYELFFDVWREYVAEQGNIPHDDPLFAEKTIANIMTSYTFSKHIASNGYLRTKITSSLINNFIEGVHFIPGPEGKPIESAVEFDVKTKFRVCLLKHFVHEYLINSPRLKVAESRGEEIVSALFKKLTSKQGYILMPDDYQELYKEATSDVDRKRMVCDFIAGMTDRYALEFYGRLYSENPQSIFKPL